MKVAITTSGNHLEAPLETRFGRASGFIVYDTELDNWQYYANSQNLEASQGAGIQAAQLVGRLGANALITGNVGPKAFKVLAANGIKAYTASLSTVAAALTAYQRGELSELNNANVEGHWI